MLVVAVDTSSAAVTAAVAEVTDGERLLAERVVINARGHGELLAPSIAACLDEAGLRSDAVGAVVAGTGPGPFTGLRVGLVTASVFAEMLGIPAYGVCSLDAIAAACAEQGELLVVTDARRKEVYWARYRHGRRVTDPAVTRPAEVDTSGVAAVAGSGVDAYDFGLPVIDVRYPPALEVVRCASDRIREGAPSDPLTPLYLRRPDAVANLTPKQVTQ